MRKSQLVLCGFAALALSSPAWAGSAAPPTPKASAAGDSDIEVTPFVNPGDQIGIACSALTKSNADSDVRVVLTISAMPGDTGPGYNKVLATDEQVAHGAVRVRIPTVPDIENHTVNINVYVMGDKGSQSCDAGHLKIVRRPVSPPQPWLG